MFKGAIIRILILLTLLSGSVVGCVLYYTEEERINALIFVVVAVIIVSLIIRTFVYHTKKITFLFNAIESNDYTFKFIEQNGSMGKDIINQSINRIKELLVKAKLDAIEKERYYELILDSVNTGILVINGNGNVYQKNDQAMKLLGMNVLTHINQMSRIDSLLPDIFAGLKSDDNRKISVSNEHGELSLSVHVSEMNLNNEKLRIVAISDIGSQLDEKELESWTRLIRVLTHEIMNSISPINSLSETLLEIHGKTNDDIGEGLEVINSTSKGLMAFVQSYRQFTSVPQPKFELFYVDKFINRLICLVQNDPSADNVCFQTDIQDKELILYADENQISQVVINLMKNAVQALAGRPNAIIKVSAYCTESEKIIIEVENNGNPIPLDVASHIFIPFFTTKEHGSGIGLSLSRQIMRLHNGTLKLRVSDAEKTTFTLTFN